jgi:RNA polymerase sigma-70 factor (ECF subfamily)
MPSPFEVKFDKPSPEESQSTFGLLVKLRSGNREAANLLFAQHGQRLKRALRARLSPGVRRRLDIDEVVQETFLKALEALDGFEWRNQGAFLGWLLQIALHRSQDLLRNQERTPSMQSLSTDPGEESGLAGRISDDHNTPSEVLSRADDLSLLERALEQLGDSDRDLVVRRALLGQDYASLAEELGITEGAVRMRMSRAVYEMSRWAHAHE